jgi:hypothetical protein
VELKQAVNEFYDAHVPKLDDKEWDRFSNDDWHNYNRWLAYNHGWKEFDLGRNITVGSGSSIQFGDMSIPLVREGYRLQEWGTQKIACNVHLIYPSPT